MIIPTEHTASKATAVPKRSQGSELRAYPKDGDRGQRALGTALLRDRLRGEVLTVANTGPSSPFAAAQLQPVNAVPLPGKNLPFGNLCPTALQIT